MFTKLELIPSRINLYSVLGGKKDYLFIFGRLGFIKYSFNKQLNVRAGYNLLKVQGKNPLFSTYLKIISNFYKWVSQGTLKEISLVGLGFKFRLFRNKLLLVLGYSHIIKVGTIPNVCIYLINNRNLELFSINVFNLNIFIYMIQSLKTIDPYKGKGIFVKGKKIFRKASKKLEY